MGNQNSKEYSANVEKEKIMVEECRKTKDELEEIRMKVVNIFDCDSMLNNTILQSDKRSHKSYEEK